MKKIDINKGFDVENEEYNNKADAISLYLWTHKESRPTNIDVINIILANIEDEEEILPIILQISFTRAFHLPPHDTDVVVSPASSDNKFGFISSEEVDDITDKIALIEAETESMDTTIEVFEYALTKEYMTPKFFAALVFHKIMS